MPNRVMGGNPWVSLPRQAPYVLPEDLAVLDGLRREYGLHLDVLPAPYAGDPVRATVCILTLNPGYAETDHEDHLLPRYFDQRIAALTFKAEWPFPYLDPQLATTGGGRYWQSRLRRVLAEVGDAKRVAQRLMIVEHFPYASQRFDALPEILPSQVFSFRLVGELARRGCLMVVVRRLREWQLAVPELIERNDQVLRVLVPRSGFISPGTLGPQAFERVVAALKARG
jgi:hypothetical protein